MIEINDDDLSMIIAALSNAISFFEFQIAHSGIPGDRKENLRYYIGQLVDLQDRLITKSVPQEQDN